MSRNAESRFSKLPSAEISRSRFDRSSTHKTTFNAGKLVPIFVDEVLPGDTFSMDIATLVRMSTPIFPVMDNAYMDTYFFFVPNRLVWEHWKEFNGENNSTYWAQEVEYSVPTVLAASGDEVSGWYKGSVADYMGIPTQIGNFEVNALPFRAYTLIWNEWFRDQNTMAPAEFYKDDTNRIGVLSGTGDIDNARLTAHLGGDLLPVCKYHDYFTSCLPAPQKGPAVQIPFMEGLIPVTSRAAVVDYNQYAVGTGEEAGRPLASPLEVTTDPYNVASPFTGGLRADLNVVGGLRGTANASAEPLFPTNLWASLSGNYGPTINELRTAFQIQKLYEKDARGGTRYTEILKMHFGVESPDARLQRPEYLGGKRIPINIDQVLQTSSTDETSPQGNTAAYSLTVDTDSSFTKSFTEHGFIIGLCCVRTDHTYQQGLDKMWSRKRRFDYYWPALANIGEQAVLKKEIYLQDYGDSDETTGTNFNGEAFGYQEAWAEYRYKPNRVSGAFRSNVIGTLDSWHYADYFNSDPQNFVVQEDFIAETSVNIDRTLAVQSSLEDQFIADFYFKCDCVRPMPLYSIPGLIDHH